RPITYYHVELLANLDGPEAREEMLRRAVEGCWSGNDLAYHIHQMPTRKDVADGRGRPLATPKDLDDLLKQQARPADDFLNRSVQVWAQDGRSLLDMLQGCTSDKITPERIERLREHAQKLRRLAEEAQKRAEEAEEAYQAALRMAPAGPPASVPVSQ